MISVEKFKKSIKTKLQVEVIGAVAVILLVLSGLTFTQCQNIFNNELNVELLAQNKNVGQEINEFLVTGASIVRLATYNSEVKQFAKDVPSQKAVKSMKNYKHIVGIFKDILAQQDFISSKINSVYVGSASGDAYYGSDDWDPPAGYVIKQRPWYKAAIEKNGVASSVYKDLNTKKTVLAVSVPMYDKDKNILGVGSIEILFDSTIDFIKKFKLKKTGYVFLLDEKGDVIYHPSKTGNINSIFAKSDKVLDDIANGKSGVSVYTENNHKFKIAYSPIKFNNWTLVTAIPESEVYEEFNQFKIFFGLTILVSLITLAVLIYIIADKLLHPIIALNGAIKDVAQGNLTVTIKTESEDEIGELSRTFNLMTENLRNLVNQVSNSAQNVAANSQEMNAATEQTAQGAQQVAQSVTQLASGAGQLSTNIQELSNGTKQIAISVNQLAQGANQISKSVETGVENVNEINKAIQQVSVEAIEVAKLGDDTENSANEGKQYVNKAISKMESIKTVADEISGTIGELGQLSSEIEQIVDLIKTIAGQTNLLALNAAIEAARAGEHGKGFAVVADEVKKLATQSGEATDKITGMIKEIQQKTSKAVTIMHKTSDEVDEGVIIVNDTGQVLNGILDQVKVANTKIQGITKDIDYVAKNSENVVSIIENISSVTDETAAAADKISMITEKTAIAAEEMASVTEETSASAEEIASISQEQTASLEEINASSQMLARIAEGLNKQISIFKI